MTGPSSFRGKEKMWTRILPCIVAVVALSGCTTVQPYGNYGNWTETVQPLGPVSYCGGGCDHTGEGSIWPLSLPAPPSEATIHEELARKTASQYSVPESEVVLKNVNVKLSTEAVGTVRGWTATADAGRAKTPGN
jgi:hypothetical protein